MVTLGHAIVLVLDLAGLESELQGSVVALARSLVDRDAARFLGGPQFTSSQTLSTLTAAAGPLGMLLTTCRCLPACKGFVRA